jgi:hypothetical protein
MHFCCGVATHIGPRPSVIEVSRSHTIKQNHPEGILVKSDQPVAEAATDTTHNKSKGWISMTSSRFDPAIPANPRLRPHTGYFGES